MKSFLQYFNIVNENYDEINDEQRRKENLELLDKMNYDPEVLTTIANKERIRAEKIILHELENIKNHVEELQSNPKYQHLKNNPEELLNHLIEKSNSLNQTLLSQFDNYPPLKDDEV